MSSSPQRGEDHPPVPPTTPVFDAFAYLAFLAARCPTVRLGTHVYNLGLRHPFVAARAVQTLDIVSGGRFEFGIGASWLEEEWVAAGSTSRPAGGGSTRRSRSASGCGREPEVAHHGEFFDFDEVAFEPKPVQQPCPPILVGGESKAALRRAALLGRRLDRHGAHLRVGADADREAAGAAQAARRRDARRRAIADLRRRPGAVRATTSKRWEDLGVTRLIDRRGGARPTRSRRCTATPTWSALTPR